MKIFNLPDLGEGLPDAEIREWYIKEGDEVALDQPIVSVETAKALVDVPSPYKGKIEKLFGAVSDRINTGEPLVGYAGEAEKTEDSHRKDSGTVVGKLAESQEILKESAAGVQTQSVKASPAVRALAKKLNVALEAISGTGPNGHVTTTDVEKAAEKKSPVKNNTGFTALSAMQRAMQMSMKHSQQQVVPVTICDDADIQAWTADQNMTIRSIRAVLTACAAVPILNSHFDGEQYRSFSEVNLGIAVDTEHGLYVPVLKNAGNYDDSQLREQIERFKDLAKKKSLPASDQKDASIVLSNFGAFAGRYATPIVTPPTVAIVAIGRGRAEGNRRLLPISISVDHRLVTGGEVARFLKAMMDDLAKPTL